MPQLQPPVPPNALENAFSRVMQYNPRCMQTTFQFLSVHDRILLRTVAPFLSDLVHDPALWYHVVYVHDGEGSSQRIAPPTTPFPFTFPSQFPPSGVLPVVVSSTSASTSAAACVPSSSHHPSHPPPDAPPGPSLASNLFSPPFPHFGVAPTTSSSTPSVANPPWPIRPLLPPRWLRSLTHGLILREITSAELSAVFTSFSSIRQLTIDQVDSSAWPQPEISRAIKSSFSQLRLESLTIAPITNTLLMALFHIPEHEVRPVGILSQAETLTKLKMIGSPDTTDENTFLLIMKDIARREWSRLHSFTFHQPLPSPLDPDLKQRLLSCCSQVFSQQCMPVLQHLDIKWQFESDEEMNEFHQHLAGLPQLTQLRTGMVMVDPSAAIVNLRLLLPKERRYDIVHPQFDMPPKLTSLVCRREVLWSGIPQAKLLTTLILVNISHPAMRKSIDLFTMIGHHNLPHLATLSVPSCDEQIIDGNGVDHHADQDRVLELMSGMTALTSLHSDRIEHDPQRWNSFNWFVHLYRFGALKNLAFLTISSPHTYRTVPLPLPATVKLAAHPLYPGCDLHLPPEVQYSTTVASSSSPDVLPELPSWLIKDIKVLGSETTQEVQFGLPDQPTIVYLDTHKFREGGNTKQLIKKADQSCNVQMDIIDSSGTKNILTGVFTTVMTQLCMVTMLSHLTIHERGFMMRVSRHFYHSVLHSALWKNVTFHATKESNMMLPSSPICDLIGGLKVSATKGYDRIPSFPSLRRLTLEASPGWNLRERDVFSALCRLRLESLTMDLTIAEMKDARIRFDSVMLGLSMTTNKKGENNAKSSTAEPIIWSYADSLRQVEFKVIYSPSRCPSDRMHERVWPQLHTLKLFYQPLVGYTPSSNVEGFSIPFEELLVQSDRVIPNLTNLDLELMRSHGFGSSLKRVFVALAKASRITTMRHSQLIECIQSYPTSLTSLTIEHQAVNWHAISQLASLTELRLLSITNLPPTPIELFECIGSHRLPHLTTMSIDCSIFIAADEASCQHQTEVVLGCMSKMIALTELYSENVNISAGESPTTFNWFAHVCAFPSLKRIEFSPIQVRRQYPHDPDDDVDIDIVWRHTLMPPPKSTSPSSLYAVARTHPHLLPPFYNPSSPHHDPSSYNLRPPPSASFHVYVPTRVQYRMPDAIQNICAQEEYMHLSQEELRIVQPLMMEENGGAGLKFHDNRVLSSGNATLSHEETFTLKPSRLIATSLASFGALSAAAPTSTSNHHSSMTPSTSLNLFNIGAVSSPFAEFSSGSSALPGASSLHHNQPAPASLSFLPDKSVLSSATKSVGLAFSNALIGPPVLAALPQSTFSAAAAASNNQSIASNPFALTAPVQATATSTTPFVFQFGRKVVAPPPPPSASNLFAIASTLVTPSSVATSTSSSALTSASAPFVFQFGGTTTSPLATSLGTSSSSSSSSAFASTSTSLSSPASPFVFQFGSKPASTIPSPSTIDSAFPTSSSLASLSSSSASSSSSTSSSLSPGFVFQFGSK